MAASFDGREHDDGATAADHESTTRIVAIINHLDGVITLRDSEALEDSVTISPGETAGCELRLDRRDGAERLRDRHIEVQINCPLGTTARFWLWQADGEILYSRQRPHDPWAEIVPGNSASGGDRVLTIEDGSKTNGGIWATIRRRLAVPVGRALTRPGLRRSVDRSS
jgi:hypothetical protein